MDDQVPFRVAIRRVLGRASHMDVIAEAQRRRRGGAAHRAARPDIVLLDVRMPGMDGPTAARIIAQRWPAIAVVLCSSHGREDLPDELGAPFVAKELLTATVLLAAAGRQ